MKFSIRAHSSANSCASSDAPSQYLALNFSQSAMPSRAHIDFILYGRTIRRSVSCESSLPSSPLTFDDILMSFVSGDPSAKPRYSTKAALNASGVHTGRFRPKANTSFQPLSTTFSRILSFSASIIVLYLICCYSVYNLQFVTHTSIKSTLQKYKLY